MRPRETLAGHWLTPPTQSPAAAMTTPAASARARGCAGERERGRRGGSDPGDPCAERRGDERAAGAQRAGGAASGRRGEELLHRPKVSISGDGDERGGQAVLTMRAAAGRSAYPAGGRGGSRRRSGPAAPSPPPQPRLHRYPASARTPRGRRTDGAAKRVAAAGAAAVRLGDGAGGGPVRGRRGDGEQM
jgi:hypothetical protein